MKNWLKSAIKLIFLHLISANALAWIPKTHLTAKPHATQSSPMNTSANKPPLVETAKARKRTTDTRQREAGTYSFPLPKGKLYIGKSKDVKRRTKEQEKSGKLTQENKANLIVEKYPVRPKTLHLIEKTKIKAADIYTNGNLANIHNAPNSRNNNKRNK